MTNIRGESVFFAELDDDYQELTQLDDRGLLSKLTCYYLIAPRIILHPAYIWQSGSTHSMLHRAGRELLRPPFTELELGLHENVESYMAERIEQLRRPRQRTRELVSYEKHGSDLLLQAREMSIRFGDARRREVAAHRRDRHFRDILYGDLSELSLDATSLAEHLRTVAISPEGSLEETTLGEALKDFVYSRGELVSVDTFLKEIRDEGAPELASDVAVRKRLLALYYRTYCDRDTMIPGTRKLVPGSVVNPYDAEVFWAAMSAIFGDGFVRLSQSDDDASLRALREIRETADWERFVFAYFQTMESVDRAVRDQPDAVVSKLQTLHPGTTRTYVLKHLWDQKKLVISGAAFSSLGALGFTLSTPAGITATSAGALGLAVSGKSLRDEIRRFTDIYRSLDMVKVRETVRVHVDRAVRELSIQSRPRR